MEIQAHFPAEQGLKHGLCAYTGNALDIQAHFPAEQGLKQISGIDAVTKVTYSSTLSSRTRIETLSSWFWLIFSIKIQAHFPAEQGLKQVYFGSQ